MKTAVRLLLTSVAPIALGLAASQGAQARDASPVPMLLAQADDPAAAEEPAAADDPRAARDEERRRRQQQREEQRNERQQQREERRQGRDGAEAPAAQPPAEQQQEQAEEPPPRRRPAAQEEPPAAEAPPPAEPAPEQAAEPEQPRREQPRRDQAETPPPAEPAPEQAAEPEQQPRRERPRRDQAETPPRPERPRREQAETPPPPPEERPAEAAQPPQPPRERPRRERPAQPPAEQPAQASPPAQPPAAEATPPATPPASVVEDQLSRQGDREEAERVRSLREKLDQQLGIPSRGGPGDDRRGDRRGGPDQRGPGDGRGPGAGDRGPGRDDARGPRPPLDLGGEVMERSGDRFVVRRGGQIVIDRGRAGDDDRLLYNARDVQVEDLDGGLTRTTIFREDGSRIVTLRDRYGEIIDRRRVTRDGREIRLIDDRDRYDNRRDRDRRPPPPRFEDELPPLRLRIPQEEYIVETRRATPRVIIDAFEAPPVEEVERPYSLDEIRYSERLRDKLRRVDLDTITFDTGSASISPSQFESLSIVAEAIGDVLDDNPDAVFLVEGHTDAVGSDTSNLLLSDRRAEAVAVALSANFDIPPENLVTQGYGEQYLKIQTDGPERQNRRVTLRNITSLLQTADQQ